MIIISWMLTWSQTAIQSHVYVDDILNDCAKVKIWAMINITNAFFQTYMYPDNSHIMAVSTHFGLYKGLVMLMGLKKCSFHSSVTCHFWHVEVFESIKSIMTSYECLKTIDLTKMPKNEIYVMTDVSNLHSGAVLSFANWHAQLLLTP